MDLDDFTADELLDLLLDFNVTEEWQLLSIRDHWKQQYKNICSLFASDKVELNKRLLRLNKAYNVFTSIEQDQRRQLYLRFRSLLRSDQIDFLEENNDADQSSIDTEFLKRSRNLENIADQKQRQYEITKERRRRELEEAAAWKADREIDPARRRSQEEFEQSNSHEQSMSSSTDDASDRTSVNNETHSQPVQGVNNYSSDDSKSDQQSPWMWHKSKFVYLLLLLGSVWAVLSQARFQYQQQNSSLDKAKAELSHLEYYYEIKGRENDVIKLTTEILLLHQIEEAYFYRAYAKNALGDEQGAIADYNQAIAINPQYARAYEMRGNVYEQTGDLDRACSDWREASSLGDAFANKWVWLRCPLPHPPIPLLIPEPPRPFSTPPPSHRPPR